MDPGQLLRTPGSVRGGPTDYTFSAKGRGKGQGAAEQQYDAPQTQAQQWQGTSVWDQ